MCITVTNRYTVGGLAVVLALGEFSARSVMMNKEKIDNTSW